MRNISTIGSRSAPIITNFRIAGRFNGRWILAATAAFALPLTAPATALAQIRSVDPNDVIDADLDKGRTTPPPASPPAGSPSTETAPTTSGPMNPAPPIEPDGSPPQTAQNGPAVPVPAPGDPNRPTYKQDDLIGAAQGVFGKGAEGVARMIERILRDQGEPNGYIIGREAGGAAVIGVRYGSGTLYHKVEGQSPVYWTGPSIGFDAGLNAGSTFVLVYNLYDTEDLYHRYPAGEGAAYLVGGLNASYLRRRDVVLIPIRMGVGVRLGANVGYMKMSRKQRWLPF